MDQIEDVTEGVLRLRWDNGQSIQKRRVGSCVGLSDDAIVLVRIQREGRKQKVERLRLIGLIQTAHVHAKNVLRVLWNV